MINYDFLESELNKIGVKLDEYGTDRFDQYADRLISWNKHINLTAITEPDEIVIKHFVDSLTIMKYIKFSDRQTLVDVGCGAGFPGLPLLIANPKLDVTFVDSIKKKLYFIRETLNNTGLIARTKNERAEVLGKDDEYREKFDYATARAVAPLNQLCEYCMPLVKVGGLFIALKGSSGTEELRKAENAIKTLGGEVLKVDEFELCNNDKRTVIIIRKISQTPTKYPRKTKKIDTKPL